MDEATFNRIITIAKDYKLKQQDELVRFLVSTAYSFGYKAGSTSVASPESNNE